MNDKTIEQTNMDQKTPIDTTIIAKEKTQIIDTFFSAIKRAGEIFSEEEIDIAMKTLKVASLEMKEKEEKRRQEEEAILKEKQAIEDRKRRQEAAARAARRAEKVRRQHVESVTCMDLPVDYINQYANDNRAQTHVESIPDALMTSLDTLGAVDIEFISTITGKTPKEIIEKLRGSIYQNPLLWNECFYKGWETSDEYLSGNLMQKLKAAKEANLKYDGYFDDNIQALENLIEPDIPVEDIYVTLGSPWVPTDIIDDFILYLIGEEPKVVRGIKVYSDEAEPFTDPKYRVRHDEFTGIWEIPEKTRFRKSKQHGLYEELNYSVYGTNRMDMLYLMENILNMKTLCISDAKDDYGKIRVINKDETVKILDKQDQMIQEFKDWVWKDEYRKKRLQEAYCSKYGNIRRRVFDGSFLEFPNMSPNVQLFPYQKNSVARILFTPNTLLAHDVGSGKTYVMIAAGMELRRLGKSKKNMYVVPNNILGQWKNIFLQMYPDANLLVIDNKNFCTSKRSQTLQRIIDEDFDGIIISYSCFDMLSLSEEYYRDLYQKRLKKLEQACTVFYSTAKIDRKRKTIEDTLNYLHASCMNNVCDIPFDKLGINTLFVDEAHNYKNVGIETSINRVLGGGGNGSAKGRGMMDKVHCVQRMNNGGRVILATGTPITNSITDIFIMQKYLQDGELEFLGLQNFDAWAGMFAQKTTEFEIDVDTNSYHLATRFAKFCNIPERTSVLSSIADFHKVDKVAGIPDFDGYTDSLREGSDVFKEYLMDISNRADDVRQKRVSRVDDNLLKITSDGRKAALDMRLIDEAFGLDPDSKVIRCAENIVEEYEKSRDTKGIQLVFCDSSTPKPGFNLYHELKFLLTAMGIPENEIAFIHDAETEQERNTLFSELREGNIAILIGSTFKMGLGVNVQDRMCCLHHLDVPWRPSDMVQREGRILRQGNRNETVKIFRYITKGSFDAYSWQLLETKQRFISQILSGHVSVRDGADVDEAVLNYAEVKALAVGNPLIKKRVEVSNELDKLRILQRDYVSELQKKELELHSIPEKIEAQKKRIKACEIDIADAALDKTDYSAMTYNEQHAMRTLIYNTLLANEDKPTETHIMTYRGFDIIVPAYMKPRIPKNKHGELLYDKAIPYIYLRRNGTYIIDIESDSGISVRLNNFLADHWVTHKKIKKDPELVESGLKSRLKNMIESLKAMEIRQHVLEDELSRDGGFTEEIQALKKELDMIDEELGVKSA